MFAQNIDCGYEYPHTMFWTKNKKIMCTPVKVGFKGVFIARTCFPDVNGLARTFPDVTGLMFS